jgi:Flp pilus assembly protein TadD
MRGSLGRLLPVAAVALSLAGCGTSGQVAETTGSLGGPVDPLSVDNSMLGTLDPKDNLSMGKRHYKEQNYGLAEKYFRRVVEAQPQTAEAWVGLAASYDRLRRFDLADRAYAQAIQLIGPTPELLNNEGFSYMLRGDYKTARKKLLAAQVKDPNSIYIQNNLDLLAEVTQNKKGLK